MVQGKTSTHRALGRGTGESNRGTENNKNTKKNDKTIENKIYRRERYR